ncbi:PEGA domain-containing protein [Candidatus Microgenomates bacterium]|nr:MAG: PEGA domain-containing protein [Candidatus Microgenomates bacterium]
MRKQLLISLLVLFFLFVATTAVIIYGRGYRLDLNKNGKPDLSGTGLLVATSTPNGAQVFVNDQLTTATDNTINLPPGIYDVKIFKEGYFPWKKKLKVQKEVVSKAEALLFSTAPKLENITAGGVESPIIDPSMTKIAYTVSSQTPKKNGIYILDTTAKPILTLQSASTQIIDDSINTFSKAAVSWSPDGKNLIATTSGSFPATYLLTTSGFNDNPNDATLTLPTIEKAWLKDKEEKEKARFDSLKPSLRKIISANFNIVSWSPDETKILYQASQSAALAMVIKPRLIGADSTEEDREIKKDKIYVYDIKEDKNYILGIERGKSPVSWLPDSNHLISVSDKRINILESDGTNSTTVYAGPFIDTYVFPWSNTSKILILTNLNNPNILPNLYTIELK